MKTFNKIPLLFVPLLLITSCENRTFVAGEEIVYLPKPTRISFVVGEDSQRSLLEEKALEFYDKYLNDLRFEKDRDVFHGGFTFNYYYNYEEYGIGDQPLTFTLGNFNYVWFEFNYRSLCYRYVFPEKVPYLEMVNYLTENSLVAPK